MQVDLDNKVYDQSSPYDHPLVYASFVLRCQISEDGHVRARLVDVRTGNTYPLAALERLPGLVKDLIRPIMGRQDDKGDES